MLTRVEALHKRYRRGQLVLAGVDCVLEPGSPVVLSGANGSGKSTLLRIVAGAAAPTAGRVRGRPRVVGYLPDRFPALLRLPVEAYLRHLAAIRGVPADLGLLDELGFTGSRADPMARLSKGNAQKVGLTQALGCGAGLLVLDEPWAGLDAAAAAALAVLLAERARAAAVLVTDHTGRAARLPGARHLALAGGRVKEHAPAPAARAGDAAAEVDGSWQAAPVGVPTDGAAEAVLVVVRSPDPVALRARLGLSAAVEGNRLRVRVAAGTSDALLLAVLQCGGSVESVGPG